MAASERKGLIPEDQGSLRFERGGQKAIPVTSRFISIACVAMGDIYF